MGNCSSVDDLKTCFNVSRVHSSSFCQKSELVIGIPRRCKISESEFVQKEHMSS